MEIVSTSYIPGEVIIKSLGIVKGTVVESKHIGTNLLAGIKNIVGKEITSYTEMLQNERETATKRMIEEAEKQNADAIVNVRYASTSLMRGAVEIIVYGTAVKVKK